MNICQVYKSLWQELFCQTFDLQPSFDCIYNKIRRDNMVDNHFLYRDTYPKTRIMLLISLYVPKEDESYGSLSA